MYHGPSVEVYLPWSFNISLSTYFNSYRPTNMSVSLYILLCYAKLYQSHAYLDRCYCHNTEQATNHLHLPLKRLESLLKTLSEGYQYWSIRDHSVYAPSQSEMALHCNTVSHWLGTEWTMMKIAGVDCIEHFGSVHDAVMTWKRFLYYSPFEVTGGFSWREASDVEF